VAGAMPASSKPSACACCLRSSSRPAIPSILGRRPGRQKERPLLIDIRRRGHYHFSILSSLPAPRRRLLRRAGAGVTQRERFMKKTVCAAFLAAAAVLTGRLVAQDKPKYKIAEIMEKAHKGGPNSLRNKALAGLAGQEELKKLVELYTELGKNTPPKGTKEAWKKKTDAVLTAAKKVAADPKDGAALKMYDKATTCMACHNEHKGDDD